ncbi:MAG: MATE family efflux transporter [Clostridia bacterium]
MKKINFESILKEHENPSLKITLMAVLTIALPAIIEQIMITAVQYIDTAMVGSLGQNATAAVGLTSSTTWLFNGLLSGAAIGFSVQVAQHIGAGRIEKARSVIRQSLTFVLIFGISLATIGFSISFFLPTWLGADVAIISDAGMYFRILSMTIPFNFCVLMLSGIIRCAGDSKTPMLLNLCINILNVCFNFLFINATKTYILFGKEITVWGAGLGVAGAALGSGLALFIISMIYLYVIFHKYKSLRIHFKESFKIQKDCFKTMLNLGIPVALERTLMCVAQIVITVLITSMGTVAVAANYLAVTAEAISYLPAYGVAAAGTTLVGQAMGAGRKDIALKCGRIVNCFGVAIMVVTGFALFMFAEPLIKIFSSDLEVIALGSEVLKIVAFAEPLFGLAIVITGVLRGAGDTKAPFIICLITMWGVRITLAFLLAPTFGLSAVWIAMSAELVVRGLLFLFRFESKKWMKIKLFD